MSSYLDLLSAPDTLPRGFAVFASLGFLAAVVLLNILISTISGQVKLPNLPIALQKELPKTKDRIERYVTDTRELLIHGYTTVWSRSAHCQIASNSLWPVQGRGFWS